MGALEAQAEEALGGQVSPTAMYVLLRFNTDLNCTI